MYNQAIQKSSNLSMNRFEMQESYYASSSFFGDIFDVVVGVVLFLTVLAGVSIAIFIGFTLVKLLANCKGLGASKAAEVFTKDYEKAFAWTWSALLVLFGSILSPIWRFLKKLKWIIVTLVLGLILLSIAVSYQLVDTINIKTGQVLINMKDQNILRAGRHVIYPFANQYILVHTANYNFEIPHITADSVEPQDVNLHASITFKFDEDKIFDFYKREGVISIADATDTLVSPKSIEAIKNVIKEYSYKDVLSKQTEIKDKSLEMINERLNPMGVLVTDLTLVNIIIPREYVEKIQQRDLLTDSLEIEKQKLEEAKLITQTELEFANRDKQKSIIKAEGIAEANRITSAQTLTNNMLELKKLEIQKELIEKWDGSMPQNTGDNFSLIK